MSDKTSKSPLVRVVKHGEQNYVVEARYFWFWRALHSTPGFYTKEKAEDFIRSILGPAEVVSEFNREGKKL